MSDRDDLFGDRRSRRRNPARFLAPVFLIVVIGGTYLVVHQGINKINQKTTGATTSTRPAVPHLNRTQRKYAKDKFYVVQTGDNLTLISHKTGVSVGKLQSLNRRINPNSLQLGQRIRLRR
jgi:spore germination protein YaaH